MPSATVSYYSLNLLDRHAITGAYVKGYTHHAIKMIIQPKGSIGGFGPLGFRGNLDATGYTNYNVSLGSIVKDSFGRYYVLARPPEPWTEGDEFKYYVCDLKQTFTVPFPTDAPEPESWDPHFYGFEIINDTQKFEDGFERGWY